MVRIEERLLDGEIGMMLADRFRAIGPEFADRVLRTRFVPRAGTPDEILSRVGFDPARVARTLEEPGGAFRD